MLLFQENPLKSGSLQNTNNWVHINKLINSSGFLTTLYSQNKKSILFTLEKAVTELTPGAEDILDSYNDPEEMASSLDTF